MTQPAAYTPGFDFASWDIANPGVSPPGYEVALEFDNIAASLNAAINNLGLIQRDDTRLANLSVNVDQLAATVLALIGAGGFRVRGAWAAATVYAPGDMVLSAGSIYLVILAHTSSVSLIGDVTAGKVAGPVFSPPSAAGNARVVTATPAAAAATDDVISMKVANVASSLSIPDPATCAARELIIADGLGQAMAYPITIIPAAGLILGAAEILISTPYGSLTLRSDGTQWLIVAST